MLDPIKTREREVLLEQMRELDQSIAGHQRELWELQKRREARLPIEEQFALTLTRAIEMTAPPNSPTAFVLRSGSK